MRDINLAVIHCSATKPSMDIGVNEIRSWHKDRGWSDIGYHVVIRRDGTAENGRDITKAGAHAKGFNAESIGICLVGGVNEQGGTDANFTAQQYTTLSWIVNDLKIRYEDIKIIGHRDVSSKACPCFDVESFISTIED